MSDLGPMPKPTAEEPQLIPGGTDALDDPEKYGGATPGAAVSRDQDPENNPSIEDVVPDEIKKPDDKKQEPDDEDAEEAGTTEDTGSTTDTASTDATTEPPA